ncbi:MAG TPA: helix-turn-helix transcriptional regulator [Candidatus Onthocola gallistercoris]|uniref:Helix-turn-helix transcriptional regulator n=1 Tax=Candidatus Onthocola gallistercoris TaxID=2840876 RepID=A0A9D1KXD8_9FIRM|nr:helix-turn-helix transcriptional regulator [Candidatus Onthocola gallistercoris]
MNNFSTRLKNLRLKYYWNQSQLAKRAGVSTSLICSYEKSERYPSLDVLIKLSDIFCCSTDYLLGLDNRQTFEVSGLTDSQLLVLTNIVEEFKKLPKSTM